MLVLFLVLPCSAPPHSFQLWDARQLFPLPNAYTLTFYQECCSQPLENDMFWSLIFPPPQVHGKSWDEQLSRLQVERLKCQFCINAWFYGDPDGDRDASLQCKQQAGTFQELVWFQRRCFDVTICNRWSWCRWDVWEKSWAFWKSNNLFSGNSLLKWELDTPIKPKIMLF